MTTSSDCTLPPFPYVIPHSGAYLIIYSSLDASTLSNRAQGPVYKFGPSSPQIFFIKISNNGHFPSPSYCRVGNKGWDSSFQEGVPSNIYTLRLCYSKVLSEIKKKNLNYLIENDDALI